MANQFYEKQSKTIQAFVYEMARFLMDDLGGFTGPGWTVVHAYDPSAAAPHSQPSGDGTSMTQLAADNKWRTGAGLSLNSYVILENNSPGTHFYMGIEYQANDTVRMIIDPKAGFLTGSANNDMTNAAHWSATVSATIDADTNNAGGAGNCNIVADEYRTAFVYEDGTDSHMQFAYFGDIDTDDAGVTYKAGIYTTPSEVGFSSNTGLSDGDAFDMISPVDDTTLVDAAGGGIYFDGSDSLGTANYNVNAWSSGIVIDECPLNITTVGHIGRVGKMRGVYLAPANSFGTGVVSYNNDTYLLCGDSTISAKIVLPWTGNAY